LNRNCSNFKFNCSETEKRPDKYIGFPVVLPGGKKRGPSPSFFPPPPHPAFLGLFSALLRNGIADLSGAHLADFLPFAYSVVRLVRTLPFPNKSIAAS
ncbi:MAG: hypothetical protein LBU19_10620, partial [Treponema sp.]|nr:hypothetical protein [Treponema sp.]